MGLACRWEGPSLAFVASVFRSCWEQAGRKLLREREEGLGVSTTQFSLSPPLPLSLSLSLWIAVCMYVPLNSVEKLVEEGAGGVAFFEVIVALCHPHVEGMHHPTHMRTHQYYTEPHTNDCGCVSVCVWGGRRGLGVNLSLIGTRMSVWKVSLCPLSSCPGALTLNLYTHPHRARDRGRETEIECDVWST